MPTYQPTHLVPASGLPTWSSPDPNLAPDNRLDPGLGVMVAESFPNGWSRIVCSNEWTAWVDGRQLQLIGTSPAAPAEAAPTVPAAVPAVAPVAAPASARPSVASRLRNAIGVAAVLAVGTWLLGVFTSSPLTFAVFQAPWLVGLGIAAAIMALRSLWRRDAPGPREIALFVLQAAVAISVLWAFVEL